MNKHQNYQIELGQSIKQRNASAHLILVISIYACMLRRYVLSEEVMEERPKSCASVSVMSIVGQY